MTKRNDFIWKGIQTICWFIFAGLCVQTGSLLFNLIYSLFRPIATRNLHLGLNLSHLYAQSQTLYVWIMGGIIVISAIKASVFYHVIRLFRKLRLVKPFTEQVATLISTISYYAFAVGVASLLADEVVEKLLQKGYELNMVERYWSDSGAYLMMSAILFAIALVFKKGIELQSENDLTV